MMKRFCDKPHYTRITRMEFMFFFIIEIDHEKFGSWDLSFKKLETTVASQITSNRFESQWQLVFIFLISKLR